MKTIRNLLLIPVFAFGLFVSCDVERLPFNQIEQTEAFETMSDAESLMNGLLIQQRNRMYGMFMHSTDVQADLLNATYEYGNVMGFPHTWEGLLAGDYTIRDVWSGYYSALTNINNFLDNLGNIQANTDEDLAMIETYYGQAYFLRAFYYHQLVIRWAKPYDPATASTDLGVPLILRYDPTAKPARATVQRVYDQILEDIGEAKSRLSGGEANAKRPTGDAVLAFEARVHLHMQNWQQAATVAQDLIGTGRYPLIQSEDAFGSMWLNDEGSEIIYHLDARMAELPTNRNHLYMQRIPGQQRYRPYYVPQQWVVDLYEENDIRKNAYLQPRTVSIGGEEHDNVYLVYKYQGNPELYAGNTNYQHKPIVLRIAETYLNRAEALYHFDQDGALSVLNDLRQARGLGRLENISGNQLFEAIKEERTRELLAEGFRLNDLMRWGEGVERKDPQNIHIVVPGSNFIDLVIAPGHDKFVWGIPTRDITTNENLVQNPGW